MSFTTSPGPRPPKRGFDFSLENLDWDYPAPSQEGVQYLILSSPRSGSTMLASALITARNAGVPIEYLHNRILSGLGAPLTAEKVMRHLEAVRRRRTTPNGAFGMKLHGGQFRALFMHNQHVTPDGMAFLKRFTHVLVISRRDKIAQAMSYIRSVKTGVWNSAHESDRQSARYVFAEEDAHELCRLISTFLVDELLWKQLCATMDYKVFHTTYEELAAEPVRVMSGINGFLGLPFNGQLPTTQRLSVDDYESQKQQFLTFIGAA